MNVNLTPELEQLVHNKVQTGRYNSASEVVREALRLMEEQDKLKTLDKDEIRRMIDEGFESIKQGRVFDGETVFAEMEAELDELERNGHK